VGEPKVFSKITLRPLGPKVTFTASVKAFIPLSKDSLAFELNFNVFAIS